jgi:hypothetical protein
VRSARAAFFCCWSKACSPHPARSADWPHGPCATASRKAGARAWAPWRTAAGAVYRWVLKGGPLEARPQPTGTGAPEPAPAVAGPSSDMRLSAVATAAARGGRAVFRGPRAQSRGRDASSPLCLGGEKEPHIAARRLKNPTLPGLQSARGGACGAAPGLRPTRRVAGHGLALIALNDFVGSAASRQRLHPGQIPCAAQAHRSGRKSGYPVVVP